MAGLDIFVGDHGHELKIRDGYRTMRVVKSDEMGADVIWIGLTPHNGWLCGVLRVEPDAAHAMTASVGGTHPGRCHGDELLQPGGALLQ